MKRGLRTPSPALVISLVALFVALGGTSLAASKAIATGHHKDKKADTRLIKKLAPKLSVKHAKTANSATSATSATNAAHATSADSATDATQLGGVAASGYQKAPRWALVQPDGTIVAQSGGITLVAHTAGRYTLNFGSPVTGHLIVASLSVANDDSFRGPVSASPCVTGGEGDPAACLGGDNPNHLQVFTDNPGSTATQNHAFYVAVF
jgi:hypothetical protein